MDVKELLDMRRVTFIETRSKIEIEVNRYLDEVSKIDPKFLNGIPPLNGTTAREVLPSAWVEPFNREVYLTELAKLNEHIEQVKRVGEALNARALEVLKCS